MNCKTFLFAGLAATLAMHVSQSATAAPVSLTESLSPDLGIPDGDLSGIASTMDINSPLAKSFSSITSVTLSVDVVGAPVAWNGDFYAYLQFGPDLCVLVDNIGTPPLGSPGDGFDVTFSDAAGVPNISTASGLNTTAPLTGTYAPQVGDLDNFNALSSPAGNWTLFIADMNNGDVGQLANWSLTVDGTVPDDTSTWLLMAMGLGFLALHRLPRLRQETVKIENK